MTFAFSNFCAFVISPELTLNAQRSTFNVWHCNPF